MNLEIKKYDYEVLQQYASEKLTKDISSIVLNENKLLIAVSKTQANDIIESLLISFTEVGLNKDSEPNKIGLEIENVINVFSDLAYSEDDDE